MIEIQGFVGKTNTGELTLFAREMQLLAPCLHRIPTKSGLKDTVGKNNNNSMTNIGFDDVKNHP